MRPSAARGAALEFAEALERLMGFKVEAEKLGQLQTLLDERMRETRSDGVAGYLDRLSSPLTSRAELRAVADALTVNETYFFREPGHLSALIDVVLPALAARTGGVPRPLRLLSAGCSSGEEAYSLAMLLHCHCPEWVVAGLTLVGVDLNASVLAKAKKGRYTQWALRQTPELYRQRYFREDADGYALDPSILGMVSFEQKNLFEDDPVFWRPGAFDAIFCRNVFIYFSPEATRVAVARFSQALRLDGFLFLGSAETLRGISQDFHLLQSHESFYYRHRAGDRELPAPEQGTLVERFVPVLPAAPPVGWAEAIRQASARIETLAAPHAQSPAPAPVPVKPPEPRAVPAGFTRALELFRAEQFEDALKALPPPASRDTRERLLHAAILTNRGDLPAAEQVLHQVIAQDELNAEAHYLVALCRQQRGDAAGSGWHGRTAAYLDPTFAMPHLHLGLLAKRSGNLDDARKSLRQAHALLPREDEGRVALFGGGFTREGMLQLCRAELQACGGSLT